MIWSHLNTFIPRQNGRHFPDDIFRWIFLNENVWIAVKISLKFVPKGPINNIPALVQIMAWRRSDDKPLSETMMVRLPTHICVTRPQWVKLRECDLWHNIFQRGHVYTFILPPSHAVWRQRFDTTSPQKMACCLMAPMLIYYQQTSVMLGSISQKDINCQNYFEKCKCKIITMSSRAQWVKRGHMISS